MLVIFLEQMLLFHVVEVLKNDKKLTKKKIDSLDLMVIILLKGKFRQ